MAKIRKKSELRDESDFPGAIRATYYRLASTDPKARRKLLRVLGLSCFDTTTEPPKNFRREGAKLRSKQGYDRYSLFSFGDLKGTRDGSLSNLFRLAVFVCAFPRESERFYIRALEAKNAPFLKAKKLSENSLLKYLEIMKERRRSLVSKGQISKSNEFDLVLHHAVTLLSEMTVSKSSKVDFEFLSEPDYKLLEKMIAGELK